MAIGSPVQVSQNFTANYLYRFICRANGVAWPATGTWANENLRKWSEIIRRTDNRSVTSNDVANPASQEDMDIPGHW
jgi:hypothetical protein